MVKLIMEMLMVTTTMMMMMVVVVVMVVVMVMILVMCTSKLGTNQCSVSPGRVAEGGLEAMRVRVKVLKPL